MADTRINITICARDESSRTLASAEKSVERLAMPARRAAEGIDSISVVLERTKA